MQNGQTYPLIDGPTLKPAESRKHRAELKSRMPPPRWEGQRTSLEQSVNGAKSKGAAPWALVTRDPSHSE